MALWASWPPAVACNTPIPARQIRARQHAFVRSANKGAVASEDLLNFGLCPTGVKLFVSVTEYGQIRHADTSEVSVGGFLILSGGRSYAGIRPYGFGYRRRSGV